MEVTEEAMGSNISSSSTNSNGEFPPPPAIAVVKGKRTKRQRVLPPPADAPTSSASSAESKSAAATEEEEDMANCLILLAQGRSLPPPPAEEEKFTSRRFAEAATTTAGKAGFYVYECKTCNKCFPSFQALGGHRASHKKHKISIPAAAAATEERRAALDGDHLRISMNSFAKPTAPPGGNITGGGSKSRVHECSICGSEFSSGQALGGHMRRHRPAVSPEGKKDSFLSLDLNLPAPSDDDRGEFLRSSSVGLTFAGKRPAVFTAATALVDCYY